MFLTKCNNCQDLTAHNINTSICEICGLSEEL